MISFAAVANEKEEIGAEMMETQASQDGTPRGSAPDVEEYISKAEVARRLRKQVRTIDNWMQRGILPYYKIGRTVAFKWSEIEEQLARTCRVAKPIL